MNCPSRSPRFGETLLPALGLCQTFSLQLKMHLRWSSGFGILPKQHISIIQFPHCSRKGYSSICRAFARYDTASPGIVLSYFGYGYSSGDPLVPRQTIEEVIKLLKMPPPWQQNVEETFEALESLAEPIAWPEPGTPAEASIISAATVVFAEPARSDRARRCLRQALGSKSFEYLMGLLTFVRSAHYWTVVHPEIGFEEDIIELLRCNDALRQVLLEDPEASRCDMASQLFSELESLRELHERRELEKANRELRQRAEEGELLRQEVNHRVKNSLQIVSSVLHLQVPLVKDSIAAEALRNTEARVMAIAAVHERLYKDADDIRAIKFDSFLRDLCADIARAYGAVDGIVLETRPIVVGRDQAISVALIVNELVTNVFRHARPPCQVTLQDDSRSGFKVIISDTGKGPVKGKVRTGLGTRTIGALVQQLDATLETKTDSQGYGCELFVPHPR
jgi:two-component sensor histidine kinase